MLECLTPGALGHLSSCILSLVRCMLVFTVKVIRGLGHGLLDFLQTFLKIGPFESSSTSKFVTFHVLTDGLFEAVFKMYNVQMPPVWHACHTGFPYN